MDPVILTASGIAAVMVAAGGFGWWGLRAQRGTRARRLAYDASRVQLRQAQVDATTARLHARAERAELTRAQAALGAGRGRPDEVAHARRAYDAAQRDARAAGATLRARRATLMADRAELGVRSNDPAQLPLARVMAADDAVTARWMAYETDAARLIAFPAMSDARVPATAAFLAAHHEARGHRPAASDARVTPAQFGAYRDAVARAASAFEAAEAEAWRRARAAGSAPAGPGPDTADERGGWAQTQSAWVLSAQEVAANLAQSVLARGAEALARATAPRPRPHHDG